MRARPAAPPSKRCDGAGDDLAAALAELVEMLLALGLADLLDHDLLGGLGGDAAERSGGDVFSGSPSAEDAPDGILPVRRSIVQPNSSVSSELKCLRAADTIACSRSRDEQSRSMLRSRAMESRRRRVSVFIGRALACVRMLRCRNRETEDQKSEVRDQEPASDDPACLVASRPKNEQVTTSGATFRDRRFPGSLRRLISQSLQAGMTQDLSLNSGDNVTPLGSRPQTLAEIPPTIRFGRYPPRSTRSEARPGPRAGQQTT